MSTLRTRELFDGDWRFNPGDLGIPHSVKAGMLDGLADEAERKGGKHLVVAFVDKGMRQSADLDKWRRVTLPHDWVVEGPFEKKENATHGYRPRGVGFYRKVFSLPDSDRGRKLSLEFDGVFRNATVWVNGHHMLDHASGYTGFPVDISDVARYGEEGVNCVLVRVDARDTEGWWYEGAGIYRHVWLVKTGRIHVAQWGTFVTTPVVGRLQARVRVETAVRNETREPARVTVRTILRSSRGRSVASSSTGVIVPADGREEAIQSMRIARPQLWSLESPALYRAFTEIRVGGRRVDEYRTVFGVRTMRFDPDRGFFLNGKHTPIKGTCNHQDFAGVGVALPDSLHEYKIRVLRGMGSNAYRCAHHPPAPELLDACDRLGMLVMDENRKLESTPGGLADLESMILRDRNHPCIFIWGMENEEPLEGTPMGARILDSLVKAVHRLDPTRPATAAQNHGHLEGGYSDKVDVKGFNYGHNNDKDMDFHRRHPRKPVMATESNATTTTRGVYEDLPKRGYANAYGTNVWKPPYTWNTGFFIPWQDYLAHPCLSGVFVWSGFDYRGEPSPYRWPAVVTNYGQMDLCGFPKDGYWHHRAMWSKEPVLHLMPHWNWRGREGKQIKVWALTNLDRVELYLNGRFLGSRDIPRGGNGEWLVPYAPGTLRAVGWKGGRKEAVCEVATTGPAVSLHLETDRSWLKSDGRDAVPVRMSVLDSAGRVVPTACPQIRFALAGPARLIGVGNGDPSCNDSEKGDRVRAFNGHALAIIQSGGERGKIRLVARSPGLHSAFFSLRAR